MATQLTTGFTDGTSSDARQSMLDSVLLERGVYELVATVPVQVKPFKPRSGKTIIWRRYEALALATTPLTEGVTPSGRGKTVTDVSATLAPYGDYIVDSDFLLHTQPEAVAVENMELLGQQRGETLDKLYMNEWATATNIQYANGAATASVNTIAVLADFQAVVREMRNNKAKVFTPMVEASQKIGTGSIMPAYWCILTEDMLYDVRGMTGFKVVSDYGNSGAAITGEIGALTTLGIRFLPSPNGEISLGGGATGGSGIQETSNAADVHSAFIVGKNAMGGVQLGAGNSRSITKGLGSSGVSDPLDQRASFGWKVYDAREILNHAFFYELQAAVSS